MTPIRHLLWLAPTLIGVTVADLPRKAPLSKYSTLWTDSPFTSKPPPAEQAPALNPLENYALAGVSPIGGGYRVTLLDRKDPVKRIVVETGKPSEGFKILAVNRKQGDPLGTVVQMSSGSVNGSVKFDESLLTLQAPPAQQQPAAQLPPGIQPAPQPPGNQPPQRQPRPRVVPPPNLQPGAQPGVQPGVQPGAQPGVQRPVNPSPNPGSSNAPRVRRTIR
jgi:hypothetical protein